MRRRPPLARREAEDRGRVAARLRRPQGYSPRAAFSFFCLGRIPRKPRLWKACKTGLLNRRFISNTPTSGAFARLFAFPPPFAYFNRDAPKAGASPRRFARSTTRWLREPRHAREMSRSAWTNGPSTRTSMRPGILLRCADALRPRGEKLTVGDGWPCSGAAPTFLTGRPPKAGESRHGGLSPPPERLYYPEEI